LNNMRNGYKTSNTVRADMGANAENATALIAQISADVLKLPVDDERRFDQYQTITKAKEDLLLARYETRGYTGNASADNEQKAIGQLDAAVQGLQQLNTMFSGSQADRVKQLETALTNYRKALQAFKAATTDIVTARKEMTAQGQTIVQLSDDMYKIQLDRRDSESADARNMQLICTLLALILGVLAAVIITRQITRPLRETLAVVERIASGDLTQTMAVTRRDELGVLQQGIQRMG